MLLMAFKIATHGTQRCDLIKWGLKRPGLETKITWKIIFDTLSVSILSLTQFY
jgi:hypothetical protein